MRKRLKKKLAQKQMERRAELSCATYTNAPALEIPVLTMESLIATVEALKRQYPLGRFRERVSPFLPPNTQLFEDGETAILKTGSKVIVMLWRGMNMGKFLLFALLLPLSAPVQAQSVEQYAETAKASALAVTVSYATLHTFPDAPRPAGWGMVTTVYLRFVWDYRHPLRTPNKVSYFVPYQRSFNQSGVEPNRHLWTDNVYRRIATAFPEPDGIKGLYYRILITSTVYDDRGQQVAADTWESERYWQARN